MADDARETPPRLVVSDSRLSWERGVVPPPFEASQTWAVELAVNLAQGRVQQMPPVLVSNGLAVQLHQLLCDRETRPTSCDNLTFKHFVRALSALHFGISADGAQRMLSSKTVNTAMFRNEQKRRLGLKCLFLKTLEAACSQSEDGGRVQARARLLMEWDTQKMALGQEADEGGGSQVSTQLQLIALRQQVDAKRKEVDEASAQMRSVQKQSNNSLKRMARSQRALGEEMERTQDAMGRVQDECKLRLKKQKDAAHKRQALTKDQLAHVRAAKRQDCDSFEARITSLETHITGMERQHAQDMKGMAVKVDEAAAMGKSSLQKALKNAQLWKAKALGLEAEARIKDEEAAEKQAQAASLEVEVAIFREKQGDDKRKVSCPFRPCRFVSSTDGAATFA